MPLITAYGGCPCRALRLTRLYLAMLTLVETNSAHQVPLCVPEVTPTNCSGDSLNAFKSLSAAEKRFAVNVSLTRGIIYRRRLSVLAVSMLLNGVLNVLILIRFSNVTSLVHSYIVITVFLGLVSGLLSVHSGAF